MSNTVIQCSYCGLLYSLGDFSRTIIGQRCKCGGTNLEINYEDIKPQVSFLEFNDKKLLFDYNVANKQYEKIKKERDELHQLCVEKKLI